MGEERCPSEQVEAQLARILKTDAFRRSPSLGRFLKYLVDRALAGERESIKEYRLGVEVFDRGEDFDPKDDTIVRVQARNLRTKLDEYFENRDVADTVRFILPKGAYALQFEPIQTATTATAAPVQEFLDPIRAKPSHKVALAITVSVALAVGAWAYFATRHATSPQASTNSGWTTLLVAPFTNLSDDKGNEYFAGGLTEELIDALANVPGLRVVARNSSPHWTDQELDFGNLHQLGIDNVVEGSVRKEGGKVRISVRLIDTLSGSHLWAEEYGREIQDSLVTEQEIASAVAATLKLRFAPAVPVAAIRQPNPEAYDLYLKGRYNWHRYDAESAARGITYLERSIALDPAFAPAYVALAGCYGTQVMYSQVSPIEGYAKVREMTQQALQLDDTLAEAHTLLAGTYAWNDWNWERAEREYRNGLQLAPQSVIAHQYLASFLGALGRQADAEKEMREAIRLDPLDSLVQWGEAQLMHWRGENRPAEALLNKIAKQDPEFGLTAQLLAAVERDLGNDDKAISVLRAHLATRPSDPYPLGELGYTLGKTGNTKEAGEILKRLEDHSHQSVIPPQSVALVYLGLGNPDKALDELWKAVDARTLRAPWLRVEPVYASLHSRPRWPDLMRHVNLQ